MTEYTAEYEQTKQEWNVVLYDNSGIVQAYLRAVPHGKSLEMHNEVYVYNRSILKVMHVLWQRARDYWRSMGFELLVAVKQGFDSKFNKYLEMNGFIFETEQYGFTCRVREV